MYNGCVKHRLSCNFCQRQKLKLKHSFPTYSIVECENCKFIYRDKIFSQKEDAALYDKTYYLDLQKAYFNTCLEPNPKDKFRLDDFENRIDLLETFYGSKKLRILDIGCGTGAFGYLARQRLHKTKGVEISTFAQKIATSKFNEDVYRGEITDKNFKKEKIDVVTLWESIANIENTPELLATVYKLLPKKGKIAILTTVVDSWLYFLAEAINKISFGKINYFIQEGYPIHHANHFTRKSLKKILKKYGFKIIYQKDLEIPYKYTKLPKIFYPALITLGQIAKFLNITIQTLILAEKS